MISPAEIHKKALRHYKSFLAAVLKRAHFFPLYIKGNKGKATMPMEQLFPALRRLLEGEKSKKGYGYKVSLKTVQTRHAGEISMPDEIFFENVEDYLKFIDKEKEFLAFRKIVMQSQKQLPSLMPWMQENPMKVLKNIAVWSSILTVGKYFLQHPTPNVYTRALPIDIPTTFIETHIPILKEVLEAILPSFAIDKEAPIFEKRFGLLYDEPIIRMRALDNGTFGNIPLLDISLPLSIWQTINPTVRNVFITTDKMNFLRFPDIAASLIIYGDVSTLRYINKLDWLKEKQVFFWGDIQLKSFQILSNLRSSLPQITSFLLDQATFKTFQVFTTTINQEKSLIIPLLTDQENEFFLYLGELEKQNCLEQKHISQIYLLKKLKEL